RYAAVRAGSLDEYRRLANAPDGPRIPLRGDGIGAFRESYEARPAHAFPVWGAFTAVATGGGQVGVHGAVARDPAAAWATWPGSTIQKRLVLRLASEDDYLTLGVPKDVLSLTSPPGRGVLDENEVQVAVLGGDPNVALQARELGKLRDAMVRLGIPQAPGVERL